MVIILVFLLISWCIDIIHLRISFQWKSKKRKYMTKQGGNSDEEGTTESANKNLPKHDLIRQNIRETQNIEKSMVKKKRGRQCLPMARRQCKEERKKRGSTINGGST